MTLRLNGSTSGYTEIDAPAVAGNNTLILPGGNGTSGQVLTTNGSGTLSWADRMTAAGPAFSAYQSSSQSITNGAFVKVNLQSEDFDTANCFDTSLSRFTPNVAGYYQVNLTCSFGSSGQIETAVALVKNGSILRYVGNLIVPLGRLVNGSMMVYMNGTTDYLEMWFYSSLNGSMSVNNTMFSGFLARPA